MKWEKKEWQEETRLELEIIKESPLEIEKQKREEIMRIPFNPEVFETPKKKKEPTYH